MDYLASQQMGLVDASIIEESLIDVMISSTSITTSCPSSFHSPNLLVITTL